MEEKLKNLKQSINQYAFKRGQINILKQDSIRVLVAYSIKEPVRLSSSLSVMRVGTRPLGVRTGGAK